ncbi:MAG: hypothetical protein WAX77_01405, partial [Methylococcaceae bacterium]
MATYTTTQDGNDQSDATWGGGGHPTSNDDIRVIGHKVTYDAGVSAVTWGNITINNAGMLVLPINASSTLSFSGTAVLTVNSGGEIRTGTTSAAAAVGSAYTLTIQWSNGTTARNVFVVAVGGKVDIRGDASYYGDRYAYLDSNWTTGNTVYLQGNMTGKWAAGHVFYIFDNADSYTSYQLQGDTYTISSVGAYDSGNDRTPVVVPAANPTRTCYAVNNSGWRSMLCMCSRNVILKDTGQNSFEVYGYNSYTEYISIAPGTQTSQTVFFSNCLFQGFGNVLNNGAWAKMTACAAVNCVAVLSYGTRQIIDIDAISCSGVTASNQVVGGYLTGYFGGVGVVLNNVASVYGDGFFVSCGTVISGSRGAVSGEFICCGTLLSSAYRYVVTGDFFNNQTVAAYTSDCRINGDMKNNATIAVRASAVVVADLSSVSFPSQAYEGYEAYMVLEGCTVNGGSYEAIRIYGTSGNILPLDSSDTDWQTPNSGHSWIM